MDKNELINKYIINNNLDMEKIINEYSNYIYKIIQNNTNNLSCEDIEEIVLDVFLAIWNNQNTLNKDLPLKPYLIGITKNVIKNKYRNIHFNYNIGDYEECFEVPVDINYLIEQNEKNKIIKNTLNQMNENDKKIFLLFYYNSMSILDISKLLNISKTNVKTKLFRIRKKLKKALIKGGYDYE